MTLAINIQWEAALLTPPAEEENSMGLPVGTGFRGGMICADWSSPLMWGVWHLRFSALCALCFV